MRTLPILVIGLFIAVGLAECAFRVGLAHAEQGQEIVGPRVVADAVRTLQPNNDEEYTRELAESISIASGDYNIDYKVLASVIMRESSFREDVEQFKILGAQGERGLSQVLPGTLRTNRDLISEGCTSDLIGHACQIRFGAALHARWRERCPGSTWRWVAAYGSGTCPTEEQARQDRRAKRANVYYRQIAGNGEW